MLWNQSWEASVLHTMGMGHLLCCTITASLHARACGVFRSAQSTACRSNYCSGFEGVFGSTNVKRQLPREHILGAEHSGWRHRQKLQRTEAGAVKAAEPSG